MAVAAAIAVPSAQTVVISGKHPARRFEAVGPGLAEVPMPAFPGAHAIWGATGQDSRGHIWFGVTAGNTPVPSAHLVEYDPDSGRTTDHGDVIDQLKQAGVLRAGEHQAKIHSRIVQGADDFLYFSSMDEEGERDDGSRLPTWGGHMWRYRLGANRWEHLFAVAEALIAVGAGDRFVYALGYFGHVLYQYDTKTGASKHVEVRALGGHVSRNFIVDVRGHAYVPRLRAEETPLGRRVVRVSIVEFDGELREIKETRLDTDHYLFKDNLTESHGITALQEMADRSWYFTTHVGFLFHVVPPPATPGSASNDGPADVVSVSWFHPNGRTYVASLFTSDGTNTLIGLSRDNLVEGGTGSYQWLTCELAAVSCRVAPFQSSGSVSAAIAGAALYGSSTRDAHGVHYVVGTVPVTGEGNRPVALRVQPRATP